MKKTTMYSLLCVVMWITLCSPATAQIFSNFTETFSGGSFSDAAWTTFGDVSTPTLTLETTVPDRAYLDGNADGYLHIQSDDLVAGVYGATRSLGTVTGSDVGHTLSVDFTYEKTVNRINGLRPSYALDGVEQLAGFGINTFGAGDDPDAGIGWYSIVAGSALSYTVQPEDIGKQLDLRIHYYDGATTQQRYIGIDTVQFTNVVPEPGTFAFILSLLSFAGILVSRRIRRCSRNQSH